MATAYSKCYDPTGARYGIPTYPWRYAPDGLATRRQLRAKDLRPGGQPVCAQLMLRHRGRKSGAMVAYLYREDLAKPVRPMTSRKWGALALYARAGRATFGRNLDGYWTATYDHAHSRVSGVLIVDNPAPWTWTKNAPVLWQSPDPKSLPAPVLPTWAGYRRLNHRYERKPGNYLAFLGLAAALCCYKRLLKLTM